MPANPAGAMRDSRDSRNDLAGLVIFGKEGVFFFTRGGVVLRFMALG
jgi:hypothetical protein